ncbi:MAG: hypothetical protein RIE08_07945 [Acidimicrobiales bacterium]
MGTVVIVAGVNGAGKSTLLDSATTEAGLDELASVLGLRRDASPVRRIELRDLDRLRSFDGVILVEVSITRLFDSDMRCHLRRLEYLVARGDAVSCTLTIGRTDAVVRLVRRNSRMVLRLLRRTRYRRALSIVYRSVRAVVRYRDMVGLHGRWSTWCVDHAVREVVVSFEQVTGASADSANRGSRQVSQ